MNSLTECITGYIDYIHEKTGFYLSFHFSEAGYDLFSERELTALIPYIAHFNPYCRFVNSDPSRHEKCMENQKQIISRLESEERIIHTCFACAREVSYPIRNSNGVMGFVTVSGYKGRHGEKIDERLWQNALISDDIPTSLTDVIALPLCALFEKMLSQSADKSPSELNSILKYLSESHGDITLDKIAFRLGRSRSYVSHLFKKKTGKSIRAYSNDLKLFFAQNLLKSGDMSVTEIALETGFEDTSYFIRLFREKYGVTPHKYKKTNLTN